MKIGVSRSRVAHLLEHVHAGHVGHHEIEQHQVVGGAVELLQALAAVVGEFHDVAAFQGQKVVQTFADIQLIVDDEDLALGAGGGSSENRSLITFIDHAIDQAAVTGFLAEPGTASGSSTRNVAPPSRRLKTSMEPPCS